MCPKKKKMFAFFFFLSSKLVTLSSVLREIFVKANVSSKELVGMWSSSEEMEHVVLVGSLIISANKIVWQKSLYLFTNAEMEFLK